VLLACVCWVWIFGLDLGRFEFEFRGVLACDGLRRKLLFGSKARKRSMGSAEDDVDNGGNQIPDSGDEEGPLVGPGAPVPVVRHKRPLEFEKAFLDSLPSAQM
jgi:hypothetical protein